MTLTILEALILKTMMSCSPVLEIRWLEFVKKTSLQQKRRGGRVVEGARLESVYAVIPYRGFESLSLRHVSGAA
jgi:hypothetical protein